MMSMSRLLSRKLVFAALFLTVAACGKSGDASSQLVCDVREYQEQGLILDKSPNRGKAWGLPPTMTNFNAFHHSLNPWLIEGFVKRRDSRTLRLEQRPVENFAELDSNTTFLVIVAPQGFKSENVLSKYFEGNYRHIDINEACPTYVGKRNGAFALATIRDRQTTGGNENYRECGVVSSLAYFGLPDSELPNYENFIKPDLLPTMWKYDTEKIRSLLSDISSC